MRIRAVGAISPEGDFNFSACYTHNYREFMGGFTDWALQGAAHVFQPGKSAGLDATFHFTFTGGRPDEPRRATIVIRDRKLTVADGHVGQADLHVSADAQTWIGFLKKEKSVV